MIVTLLRFAAALMESMLLLMNVHLYNSIVRRAVIHGNETTKKEKRRLDVNEMRTLRWMCGVTRRIQIRKEHMRGAVGVTHISGRLAEIRLTWFGHVTIRLLEHACRQIIYMKPHRKGTRGITRTRWMDAMNGDLKMVELERKMAYDKRRW